MSIDVTQQLAKCSIEITYDALPLKLVSKVKYMLLDSIGCALGGHITDKAKIALEFVNEIGGNPQASIIGGYSTSLPLAAFANSELINALDYDYLGPLTGHVAPYVIPPCLAIAEWTHASGKDLILALAVANELGGRVANSLAGFYLPRETPPYYEAVARFSFAYTIFGAVAGAGKLLNLDSKAMKNAFGIAGASAPVPATVKWDNTAGPAIMVKYNAWSGAIAQLATTSVLLAESGFTGDTTILDGDLGFWNMVGSPFFNVDSLFKDWGVHWHIERVSFKPYPVCRRNHSAIDAINEIMQEHKVKPEEIQEVIVKACPFINTPNRMGMDMESCMDVQFRNTYIFAIACYHGRSPSPAWQMPAVFKSPNIKALAEKVRVENHPRTEELILAAKKAGQRPVFRESIVEITVGGKKLVAEVSVPKGDPGNPLTEAELVEKFKNNSCYSQLKSSKTEEILQMVNELEKVSDVAELMKLLTV